MQTPADEIRAGFTPMNKRRNPVPPMRPQRPSPSGSQQHTLTLPEALNQAHRAYNQRDLAKAEQLCRLVLQARADYFDALNLLGAIAVQSNRPGEAAALFARAVAAQPDNAEAHGNRAVALQALGQLDAAIASYGQAIRIQPGYALAHFNRGNCLQELKRAEAAIASYDEAIRFRPDYAEAYCNRGIALQALGQLEAALASHDHAIRIRPGYAEAWSNRGIALQALGQPEAALASYDKALGLNPGLAIAWSNRGDVLQDLGQLEAAVASYDKAIRIRHDYAEAWSNRGLALQALRQPEAAVASYDKAIGMEPGLAAAHCNRGNALKDLDRPEAALASYDKAIRIRLDYAEAHRNRGHVLQDLRQLDAAVASYDKALALRPDTEWLGGTRLLAKLRACDWQDLARESAELMARVQSGERVSSGFPVLALCDSPALQHRAARTWSQARYPAGHALGAIPPRARRDRIRLGYYSADFHNHATAYLMAELFELHDKARFELVAFSFGPDRKDAMRSRVAAAFDRFVDVRSSSDRAVAALSRELGIDIAIDLKGFTTGSRPGIFAQRCAPVQVNCIGYPGSMGTEYMDYLIADRVVMPPESLQHCAEKVVCMPDSYQVNDRKRAIADRHFTRAELGLPPDGFVFCCFNNNFKIHPAVFDGWMRILGAVKGSVLWLLEDNAAAAGNLRREAERRGIDAGRIVFAKRMQLPEHLARHRAADLFLDTLPCNAHTTASDALWAGLPVLTRPGESFAARVAASLLQAVGLPELIATTPEGYEALAVELALDPVRLPSLRQKLADNRLEMPLFDAARYARNLEAAYTAMHERHQSGLPPDHIDVTTLPGA